MALVQTAIFLVTSLVPFIFIRNLAMTSSAVSKTPKELAQANLIGFIVGPAVVLVALLFQSIFYFL